VSERETKKGVMDLSPVEIYMLLPKTNCKECNEENCMAFAVKLVNREVSIECCTPIVDEKYKDSFEKIRKLLAPAIKEVTIGSGKQSIKIGGKLVLYRHEFTYHNPTSIAIDVTDEMPLTGNNTGEEGLIERLKKIQNFNYDYIGKTLNLDMVAIRSISKDPQKFKSTVEIVTKTIDMPLILCTFDPNVMEAGLIAAKDRRPLIYAATKNNWRDMAKLALMYNCPLSIFAPNDIRLLRSLAKTLREYGIEDLVLDPGTFSGDGLSDTINNFTMIRRNACKGNDENLGFPLIGTPITAWIDNSRSKEEKSWEETYVATMLTSRFADLLILHCLDGWAQLPVIVWRFNIYTDPRKPVSVEAGLKMFGKPNKNSPVLLTTNYALTYFTVESDIKKAGVDCYLIVVDTEGISVESAVAGRYLTANVVADIVKQSEISKKISHKYLMS
jgi:acetyl-CoA decarbonylase/synthase complex subunit gamma